MGFKLQQVVVLAGSEEFPTGNTDDLRLSRSKTLLTKCAQALIDCNVGWQLDTTKSATTTSYTDIPDKSGTKNYPGLFFVNTVSGCKLFMAYFGDSVYSYGIKDFSGSDVIPAKGYKNHGGLCISIIPGESSQTFGSPTSNTFIPSDATRICGTYWRDTSTSISGEQYSAAYNPTSDTYYSYSLMVTDSAISVYAFHTTDSSVSNLCSVPIYSAGRIFGIISHAPTHVNAYYGVLIPRISSYQYESWSELGHKSFSPYGTSIDVPWSDISSSGFPGGSFAREDGTWVNGSQSIDSYWCNASYYTTDIAMCDNSGTFNKSSSYRWSQIGMMVNTTSSQLSTLGVTPGNGFKGYLDTELFGAATPGTGIIPCDNGNRIYMGSSSQSSWVLGWDSSNPSVPA